MSKSRNSRLGQFYSHLFKDNLILSNYFKTLSDEPALVA